MSDYADASNRAQIARLRPLAREALRRLGLGEGRLRKLGHAENTTFDAHTDAGRFVVRVHRRNYNSHEMIRSELAWLDALRAEGEVSVPEAVRDPEGRGVFTLAGRGLDGPRDVVVFRWLPGHIRMQSSAAHFERLGRVTAKLHRFAATWSPPPGWVRHDRRAALYFDAASNSVHAVEEIPLLAKPEWAEVRARAVALRAATHERMFAREEADGVALALHADLHLGNVLLDRGTVHVIDFDDTVVGHPLQDIAVSIGLAPPRLRAAYRRGYASVGAWPAAWDADFATYVCARRVIMMGWLSERSETVAWLGKYLPRAFRQVELLSRWYETGDDAFHDALHDLPGR